MKRFGARKINVGSYSRQGWLLKSKESYAVYDRNWKTVARAAGDCLYDNGEKHKYVQHTSWHDKAAVQQMAEWLNQQNYTDSQIPDGFTAWWAVCNKPESVN